MKMKNKLTKIFQILIIIIFIISNFLVTYENKFYKYVQVSIYLVTIGFFLIKIIGKNPIKIIKNKLDIFVLIFALSTTISLIFNTYVSLIGTVQTILQYISAFCIYILFREFYEENNKLYSKLCNVAILITVVLILIGIDGITYKYFDIFLKKIDIGNFINGENRLISIFGNPNVFAAYIGSILFLNLYKLQNQDKIAKKLLYRNITLILIIGIILTYCKGVFLILPPILIIYIIFQKNKDNKVHVIINLVESFIMGVIFDILFEKYRITQNYLLIWFNLIMTIILNFLINFVLEKISIKINNTNKKRIVIISGIFICICVIYFIVGLNVYDEYRVFSNKIDSNYEAKIIDKIEPNTNYIFEFDIKAVAPKDTKNNYIINIIQRNEKNQEIEEKQIRFDTIDDTKKIEINTKEITKEIKIEFISKTDEKEKYLVIKNLKINGKTFPLEYKLLPTKLIQKIRNININYKTAEERLQMIKNAIELSKQNLFSGIGGTGWKYRYKEVQEYDYTANMVHCYPAKILLEFGIIGCLSYIGLSIYIILFIKKQKNKNTLSFIFAFLLLLIHSFIDIDMEYTHILIFAFILLGIISNNIKNELKDNKKISYVSNIVFIITISIGCFLIINTSIYNKNSNIKKLLFDRNGLNNKSQEYLNINSQICQVYEDNIKYERYNYLETYYNIFCYAAKSNMNNKEETLERCFEKIEKYENKNKNDIYSIMLKIETCDSIIECLKKIDDVKYNDMIEKLKRIIINEYNLTKEKIINVLTIQYKDKNKYLNKLEKIYERAIL